MRIVSVEFPTASLDRAESFYRTVLELPASRPDGALAVRIGASRLILREGDLPDSARQHLAFTIPRLTFDSGKAWLTERVPLLRDAEGRDEFETSTGWNARSAYFADPDGNILEFIIRRVLPDDVPGPFSPDQIRCISEVGIPLPDVPAFVSVARSVLGVETYFGGSESFQPVGDVNALLIAVEEGRKWFPTDETPSGATSLLVEVESPRSGTIEPSPGVLIHAGSLALG
jgi:catechol 2,3-dioxygenase-like lactoylglutathione lyase family enzyme